MEVVFTLRITTIHLRKYTRCIRIALWLLSINSVIENTQMYRSFKKSLMSSDTKECCAWDNESCNLSGMRENDIRYNVSYSRSSSKISISTIIILTALSLNQNRFISTQQGTSDEFQTRTYNPSISMDHQLIFTRFA